MNCFVDKATGGGSLEWWREIENRSKLWPLIVRRLHDNWHLVEFSDTNIEIVHRHKTNENPSKYAFCDNNKCNICDTEIPAIIQYGWLIGVWD